MPLPSSGPITFNQIHTEVGGSSNSTASLSDPDIRQLIGAQQGDTISMGEFLGASSTYVCWYSKRYIKQCK